MSRILAILFLAFSLTAGAAPAAHALELSDNAAANAANVITPTANTATGNQDDAGKPLSFPVSTDYDGALASIVQWIMLLFGWLVGVAAMTLDNAVYYTVVTMGNYVKELAAVGVAWRILRDVGNIVLIFGFLAVGITTILNVDWYGGGKKMLPAMLAAAVFLNFSLFITEAVIDTGNLVATQFYTQINGGRPAGAKSFDTITSDGISNKIMGQLGLQTIYNGGRVNTQVFKDNNSIIIGFMGILLFIILAFVLFSLAFVLIARFVMLIYLIILSPIGFAGYAVPQLKGVSDKWLKDLIGQTITAPILLLLLYVALAVITDANFLKFGAGYADWTGFVPNSDGSFNLTGFAGMILSFLVAMGLLIFVVITSKNLSAFGASGVVKLGQSAMFGARKYAGRSALGLGKYAMRQSAGQLAYSAAQGLRRTSFGQSTQAGRLMTTALDRGGKGFKEAKEKSVKAHQEYAKSVAEAIEEQRSPAVVAAQRARYAAEKEEPPKIAAAEAGHKAAKEEEEALIKEVQRLEKIVNDSRNSGKFGPERDAEKNALEQAREKLAPATAKVRETGDAVTAAKTPLITAIEDETNAIKDLKEAKQKAALAYAESAAVSFEENPITWAMAGPGGSAAANKIFRDTLKKMSDAEEALDKLQKAVLKQAKESEASAEAGKKLNEAKGKLTESTEKETESNSH